MTSNLVELVRDYTYKDADLRKCHHFLFDLLLDQESEKLRLAQREPEPPPIRYRFLAMGLNTREDPVVWSACPLTNGVERWHGCEETSLQDNIGLSERRKQKWSARLHDLCQTWDMVQSELFFWSTPDIGKRFQQRFGTSYKNSPHLPWCAELNQQLIEARDPCAIIVVGLSGLEILKRFYGFRAGGAKCSSSGKRLLVDGHIGRRRCIVLRHLTGRFQNMSAQDRAIVRAHLADIECD